MRAFAIGSTAILSVLLGITTPAYAEQEHADGKEASSRPQQSTHEQAKPQQQARPAQSQPQQQHTQQQPRAVQSQPQQRIQQQPRPAAQSQPQQHTQQQPRQVQNGHTEHTQPQKANNQQQRPQEAQRAWQDHRANNWQSDHRSWQQRGGYNGYRIPEARYGGFFGASHGFRIGGLPFMVVGGFPRFQYEGYWFSLVDPWPGDWSDDWYDTDDVYVSYQDNGYYLFNRRHPGIGIAISVSM